METQNLKVEKFDNYAIITFNREKKLNALNKTTIDELEHTMQDLEKEDSIRAVILTGAGEKAFVAGADISEISELDQTTGQEFSLRGQNVFRLIEEMTTPVIAAINGFALGGGCELAMACHLRLASSNAQFGQPEINLGIIPGYGGTQRLSRLIGRTNALYLLLTGERIDAQKALTLGLVNDVVEPGQLLDRARELARALAEKAPVATEKILNAVDQGSDVPLEEGLKIEAIHFGEVCNTEDKQEGTAAFLEKRKPKFKGR
ncbi:enoyl-CoA hydratase [Candidatus Saccharibacteria bacterium]|nr:enoyl-CoA hydratase [Calditrichia bacterium]NIV71657.1 enoyl-CoA hydratase [Calditrichia bacterium]NIV98282.1 enoyl-CoA hydratase [Candidatus Saccharibacteria bacterium]